MNMFGSTLNIALENEVHAAIAVVRNDDGKVLITRRARHAHQGGLWEFPGGKVEADESVVQALYREMREELGIFIKRATPLMKFRHNYPEKRVLLDIWQIESYSGVPVGLEGQPLEWVCAKGLGRYKFPEPNNAIARILQLPSLYLITPASSALSSDFMRKINEALDAGVRLIQFRAPNLEGSDFKRSARQVCALAHRYGASVLVNCDPDWVDECEADGVHINSRRLMSLETRPLPAPTWVAASCHNEAELRRAEALGLDFAVLSPVHTTTSHLGGSPLGWQVFRGLNERVSLPIYALGGLVPADIPAARAAAAHGVAMISGIWGAASIGDTVSECLKGFPCG